jgi:hypothetical protein
MSQFDPSVRNLQETQPLAATPPGKESAPVGSKEETMGKIRDGLQKASGKMNEAKSNLKIGAHRTIECIKGKTLTENQKTEPPQIGGHRRASTIAEKSLGTTQQHKEDDGLDKIISTGHGKTEDSNAPVKKESVKDTKTPETEKSPDFNKLPVASLKDTKTAASQLKNNQFFIRKSSDKKSLVVTAHKNDGTTEAEKFPPGSKEGTFIKNGKEMTLAEITQDYGGESKRVDLVTKNVFDKMPTEKSGELLAKKPAGSFLIRPSNSKKAMVISLRTSKGIEHYRGIPTKDGKYNWGGKVGKKNIKEIINSYGEDNLVKPEPKIMQRNADARKSGLEKFHRAVGRAKELSRGTSKGAKPMVELYESELIDAKHRYGRSITHFFKAWKGSDSEDSFQDWMNKLEKGEEVPGKEKISPNLLKGGKPAPDITEVKYLSKKERVHHFMQVDDGKISTSAEKGYVDSNFGQINHIFVVDPNNNTFIGRYNRGKFNHSSLTGGSPVQSAGELKVVDGQVVEITDKSGHYESDRKMMLKGIKVLLDQGVDLSQAKVTLNAHPLSKVDPETYDALQFYNEHKHEIS